MKPFSSTISAGAIHQQQQQHPATDDTGASTSAGEEDEDEDDVSYSLQDSLSCLHQHNHHQHMKAYHSNAASSSTNLMMMMNSSSSSLALSPEEDGWNAKSVVRNTTASCHTGAVASSTFDGTNSTYLSSSSNHTTSSTAAAGNMSHKGTATAWGDSFSSLLYHGTDEYPIQEAEESSIQHSSFLSCGAVETNSLTTAEPVSSDPPAVSGKTDKLQHVVTAPSSSTSETLSPPPPPLYDFYHLIELLQSTRGLEEEHEQLISVLKKKQQQQQPEEQSIMSLKEMIQLLQTTVASAHPQNEALSQECSNQVNVLCAKLEEQQAEKTRIRIMEEKCMKTENLREEEEESIVLPESGVAGEEESRHGSVRDETPSSSGQDWTETKPNEIVDGSEQHEQGNKVPSLQQQENEQLQHQPTTTKPTRRRSVAFAPEPETFPAAPTPERRKIMVQGPVGSNTAAATQRVGIGVFNKEDSKSNSSAAVAKENQEEKNPIKVEDFSRSDASSESDDGNRSYHFDEETQQYYYYEYYYETEKEDDNGALVLLEDEHSLDPDDLWNKSASSPHKEVVKSEPFATAEPGTGTNSAPSSVGASPLLSSLRRQQKEGGMDRNSFNSIEQRMTMLSMMTDFGSLSLGTLQTNSTAELDQPLAENRDSFVSNSSSRSGASMTSSQQRRRRGGTRRGGKRPQRQNSSLSNEDDQYHPNAPLMMKDEKNIAVASKVTVDQETDELSLEIGGCDGLPTLQPQQAEVVGDEVEELSLDINDLWLDSNQTAHSRAGNKDDHRYYRDGREEAEDSENDDDSESTFTLDCISESVASSVTWFAGEEDEDHADHETDDDIYDEDDDDDDDISSQEDLKIINDMQEFEDYYDHHHHKEKGDAESNKRTRSKLANFSGPPMSASLTETSGQTDNDAADTTAATNAPDPSSTDGVSPFMARSKSLGANGNSIMNHKSDSDHLDFLQQRRRRRRRPHLRSAPSPGEEIKIEPLSSREAFLKEWKQLEEEDGDNTESAVAVIGAPIANDSLSMLEEEVNRAISAVEEGDGGESYLVAGNASPYGEMDSLEYHRSRLKSSPRRSPLSAHGGETDDDDDDNLHETAEGNISPLQHLRRRRQNNRRRLRLNDSRAASRYQHTVPMEEVNRSNNNNGASTAAAAVEEDQVRQETKSSSPMRNNNADYYQSQHHPHLYCYGEEEDDDDDDVEEEDEGIAGSYNQFPTSSFQPKRRQQRHDHVGPQAQTE